MSSFKETAVGSSEPTGFYEFELYCPAFLRDSESQNKSHEPSIFSPDFRVNGHIWKIMFSAWHNSIPFQLIKKTKSQIKANYKLRIKSHHYSK